MQLGVYLGYSHGKWPYRGELITSITMVCNRSITSSGNANLQVLNLRDGIGHAKRHKTELLMRLPRWEWLSCLIWLVDEVSMQPSQHVSTEFLASQSKWKEDILLANVCRQNYSYLSIIVHLSSIVNHFLISQYQSSLLIVKRHEPLLLSWVHINHNRLNHHQP